MNTKPWLQFYDDVPHDLKEAPQPLYQILEGKPPQQVALIFEKQTRTYGELWENSGRIAKALANIGIHKGDRVALLLPNCFAFVEIYYGVLRRGAMVVALNPLYTPAELAVLLLDAAPKALVVPTQAVSQLPPGLPFPVIFADIANDGKKEHEASAGYPGSLCLSDWLATDQGPDPIEIDPTQDVAVLQYTGGTTGTPKGAMLTHWNLFANALQSRWWMQHLLSNSQDTVLLGLPLFHVYGMTVGMNLGLLIGARLLLLPRFTPQAAAEMVEAHHPTIFPGAPTMYVALAEYARHTHLDLSSIRGCISGSAPLPQQVQEEFERLTGGRLVEGYGLSEASPVTHCQPLWDAPRKSGIGLPYPSTEVRIVDDEGHDVPIGEAGELWLKGPQVMKGYWRRPEETKDVLSSEGWLHTGDVAVMDSDGYFRIVDRKKDMIICSGFNVYPREVEEVLYQYPAIQEASVIGIPDAYRGETIKAYIVSRSGALLDLDDLNVFCRQRLAGYKVPRFYEVVDTLPKSAVGKILRRVLRDQSRGEGPATSPNTP
jgi:long-chain acyl-CoA synthetase